MPESMMGQAEENISKIQTARTEKGVPFFRFSQGAFAIFFFILFFLGLFMPGGAPFPYNRTLQLVYFFIWTGLILTVYVYIKRYGHKLLKQFLSAEVKYLCILFLVLYILQIIFISCLVGETGWDVGTNFRNATSDTGVLNPNYYNMYPNNQLILFLQRGIYLFCKLFVAVPDMWMIYVALNIFFVDISIGLTYLLAKRLFTKEQAVITLFFLIFAYGFSPWLAINYSDTLTMLFPVLELLLFFRIKEAAEQKKKLLYGISLGLTLFFGVRLKPTTIIILIAIVLIYGIHALLNHPRNLKKILLPAIAMVSAILISNGIFTFFLSKQTFLELEPEKSFSLTHYMMMGMRRNRRMDYGGYSQDDVSFSMSFETREERQAANLEVIKQRLEAYGPKEYANFLFHKTAWMMSDGSFFWGGEGGFLKTEKSVTNPVKRFVQEIFLPSGNYVGIYAYNAQGTWLFILFMCTGQILLLRKKGQPSLEILTLCCTIFGLILFLLLFEGRARYLINHLPIFCILAMNGLFQYEAFFKERWGEYKKRRAN